jgi:hypothetical protein
MEKADAAGVPTLNLSTPPIATAKPLRPASTRKVSRHPLYAQRSQPPHRPRRSFVSNPPSPLFGRRPWGDGDQWRCTHAAASTPEAESGTYAMIPPAFPELELLPSSLAWWCSLASGSRARMAASPNPSTPRSIIRSTGPTCWTEFSQGVYAIGGRAAQVQNPPHLAILRSKMVCCRSGDTDRGSVPVESSFGMAALIRIP